MSVPFQFCSTARRRVAGVKTPCTEPTCERYAPYGAQTCCAAFLKVMAAAMEPTEEERVHIAHGRGVEVARDAWLWWSGGACTVPRLRISVVTAAGWHNGCYYANDRVLVFRTMPGFEPVWQDYAGVPVAQDQDGAGGAA